jgi:hypothetical protein
MRMFLERWASGWAGAWGVACAAVVLGVATPEARSQRESPDARALFAQPPEPPTLIRRDICIPVIESAHAAASDAKVIPMPSDVQTP